MKKGLLFFIFTSLVCHAAFCQCAGTVSSSVSPLPNNGTYYPGEIVNFCFTEDSFSQNGENWFHAMELFIGPGWDLSTLNVISVPPPSSGSGNWSYYPNGITSYATGRHLGPGFYFGSDAGAVNGTFAADNDNPGENYGDNCQALTCTWTFCFSIQVSLNATLGDSLYLYASAEGDHLSGAWDGRGCQACDSDSLGKASPIPGNTTVGKPIFLPVFTSKNVSCNGACDGTITVQGHFGFPPYTYKWNTGATTATISSLCPGNYTCTATDSHDSIGIGTEHITQPQVLTLSYDSVNPVCNGQCNGSVTINATGGTLPYAYTWSNISASTANDFGACAGTVSFTVTDVNNCTIKDSAHLVDPALLTIQKTITDIPCYGANSGSITTVASGGNGHYLYKWSNGHIGPSLDSLTAGTYILSVTDTLGCYADSVYKLTQPANRIVVTPQIIPPSCTNSASGSISLNVTGGTTPISYVWSNASTLATYTGDSISNLAPALYRVTITDAMGCTIPDSFKLSAPPLLVIDSVPTVNPSCYGGDNGQATVYAHGGTGTYTYNWGKKYPQDNTVSVQNLYAGASAVTVSDFNQCMTSATFSLGQPDSFALTVASATGAKCAGENNGSITIAGSGGTGRLSFAWNNGQVGTSDTGLSTTSVIVTITDANNCTATYTFAIPQPDTMATNPVIQNAKCFQGSDGYIVANATGGTRPYSYSWSNGEHDSIDNYLPAGVYSCTVTDVNGCTTAINKDSITQPTLVVDSASSTPVKCFGQNSGTIVLDTAWGGVPPYNFSATKDNANFSSVTNGIIMGLDTGLYTVEITDNNGCSNEHLVYVANATADNFFITTDSTTCFGSNYNDGAALITYISTQNAPYQFSIDNGTGQDTGYFQNLSAGNHVVVTTNKNGCYDTLPLVILQPLPVVVNITPDSLELPLGQKGNVQVKYENASNASFLWMGETTGLSCVDCPNPIVSPFVNSDYTVAVSMVNYNSTCYGYGTLHVSIIDPPAFFVPNAFSPNGDGVNDIFTIYGEGIASFELNVYNRWGELVYETGNSLTGWDGTYKGQMQPNGTYTYVAVVTLLDNRKITKTGAVALLR
jgi:gliding motility-associated-like protein